jgi:uncharacterized protein
LHVFLSWTTERFRCQIAGESAEVPSFVHLPQATLGISSGKLILNEREEIWPGPTVSGPPLFIEQQVYTIAVDWKGSKGPVLLTGKHLLEPVEFDESQRSVFQLNFGSSVGLASLRIGEARDVLTLEVLPRKMEYRTDYRLMKRDVVNQAHSLAFNVLGRTEEKAKQFRLAFPTEAESYVIAKSVIADLLQLLSLLDRQPHTRLAEAWQMERLAPRSHFGVNDWRRLARGRPYRQGDTVLLERTKSTVQAPENEFIKWTLLTAARRLSRLTQQLTGPNERGERAGAKTFADEVRVVEKALRNRINRGFLSDVLAKVPSLSRLSLVFQLHPIYRRIYHDCHLLLSGLDLEGYLLQMGTKDVATLYEYWSFLAVVSTIQKYARLESTSLIKVKRRGATLQLLKGRESRVRFRRADGSVIEVSYNPLMDPIYTTPQRPDAVIEIRATDVRIILDAKYRLQFDADYVRSYGGPGPTEEDINKMHRYRDAVLFQLGTDVRKAGEAVALFPLPPSEPYAGLHRFHRSLDLVGIGGIPCYPNALDTLDTYLSSRLGL